MSVTFKKASLVANGDIISSPHVRELAHAFNDRIKSGLGDPVFRIFFMFLGLWRAANIGGNLADFFETGVTLDDGAVWPPGDTMNSRINRSTPFPMFLLGNEEAGIESEDSAMSGLSDSTSSDPETIWAAGKAQRGVIKVDEGAEASPATDAAIRHYKIENLYGRFSTMAKVYGGFMPIDDLSTIGCRLSKTRDVMDRVLNFYIKDFKDFDFEKFFSSQYHLSPQKGTVDSIAYDDFGNPTFTMSPVYPSVTIPHGSPQTSGSIVSIHNYTDKNYTLGSMLLVGHQLTHNLDIDILDGSTVIRNVTLVQSDGFHSSIEVFNEQLSPNLRIRFNNGLGFTGLSGGSLFVEVTEQVKRKPEISDGYVVLRKAGGANGVGGKVISDYYFKYGVTPGAYPLESADPELDDIADNEMYQVAKKMTEYLRVVNRKMLAGYAVEGSGVNAVSVLWFYRFGEDGQDVWKGIAPDYKPVNKSGANPALHYGIKAGVNYKVKGTTGNVVYNGVTYGNGATFMGTTNPGATDVINYYSSTGDCMAYEVEGILIAAPPQEWTNEWVMDANFKVYNTTENHPFNFDAYADYYPLVNRCLFNNQKIQKNDPEFQDLSYQYSYGVKNNPAPEAPSGYTYVRDAQVLSSEDKNFFSSCRIYETPPQIQSVTIDNRLINGVHVDLVKVKFFGRFHHCETAPSSIPFEGMAGTSLDGRGWQALKQEPYRTMENAIREYLLHPATVCSKKPGDHSANTEGLWMTYGTKGACVPHFFFLKMIPRPFDYNGDPNVQDPLDSLVVSEPPMTQMELYLRAMCEGYIDQKRDSHKIKHPVCVAQCEDDHVGDPDGLKTCLYNCPDYCAGGNYDYTYRNLCNQAFGGEWGGLSMLPEYGPYLAYGGNRTVPIRPEKPKGNGVLPNTITYASVFNQYVKAINLLSQVRIELPLNIQVKTDRFEEWKFLNGQSYGSIHTSHPSPTNPLDTGLYVFQSTIGLHGPDAPTLTEFYSILPGPPVIGSYGTAWDANVNVNHTYDAWNVSPGNPDNYIVTPTYGVWRSGDIEELGTSITARIATSYTGGLSGVYWASTTPDTPASDATILYFVQKDVNSIRIDPEGVALNALPAQLRESINAVGVGGRILYSWSGSEFVPATSPDSGPCGYDRGSLVGCWNSWDPLPGPDDAPNINVDSKVITKYSGCIFIQPNTAVQLTPLPSPFECAAYLKNVGVGIYSSANRGAVFEKAGCTNGMYFNIPLVGAPMPPIVKI